MSRPQQPYDDDHYGQGQSDKYYQDDYSQHGGTGGGHYDQGYAQGGQHGGQQGGHQGDGYYDER